ncbi:response regulator [Algoriphagus sp. H41]|uniref:Response regulator n=1 Tax=Algoriphagus oliviformis TaxID=2811231 RepID=A0ABS3C8Q1_9BACT|nr:response regulator [Algoriphagus oliviformis]MBN7811974.1 response regulator [Algoriphagus oliviformis]
MGNFKIREIFLVDDDPIVRMVAIKILKSIDFNHTVSSFENGQLALDAIKSRLSEGYIFGEDEPILLLLDINMPILDAWGFLDEFSELPPAVRNNFLIAIITSSIDTNDKIRAFSYADVVDYITKPLSAKHLSDFLTKHSLYQD